MNGAHPQPTARACHPHAERRNCNFLEFTNRPSTPKPPPKAHRPPLSIHNQSDSQRQWITFHLICVPRARARGSKFHAETNFSLFPATEEQQRQMISFQPPGPSQPPTGRNIDFSRFFVYLRKFWIFGIKMLKFEQKLPFLSCTYEGEDVLAGHRYPPSSTP